MAFLHPTSILQYSAPRRATSLGFPPSSLTSPSRCRFRAFSLSLLRRADSEPAVAQGQRNKPKESEMQNAQPKILNENPPKKEEENQEVKDHNKEMEGRAEQAHEKVGSQDAYKDKTAKK